MKTSAKFVIALLLSHVVAVSSALACSCLQPGPPLEEMAKVDAVFSGKVTEMGLETPEAGEPSEAPGGKVPAHPMAKRVVTVEVKEAWKGEMSADETVTVHTAANSAACGYSFELEKDYLIYAYVDEAGQLQTNICTRTALLADAGEDVEALSAADSKED